MNVGAFSLSRVLKDRYTDEVEIRSVYRPKMDWPISNVGILWPGAVNIFLFRRKLDAFIGCEEGAADFMRVKAVLNVKGSEKKFVLQGVHSFRNQGFTEPWADGEPRENRIIFIGRGMQKREHRLTSDFQQCIAGPLRFE